MPAGSWHGFCDVSYKQIGVSVRDNLTSVLVSNRKQYQSDNRETNDKTKTFIGYLHLEEPIRL